MEKIKSRCLWVPPNNRLYEKYHDEEWGQPIFDDKKMFEFIVLESAQAGLSWAIILNKRNGYKKAFANFNVAKVAKFTNKDIERLVTNPAIIRNRAKINAAINNAKIFLLIKKEFGSFSKYIWSFSKNRQIIHKIRTLGDYPKTISEAEKLAEDLKKRGFKFFGPIVAYAHLQAVGIINDHMANCFRRGPCLLK
ncbi:MAG: DNA-3-methyladenine glycosylase I [bacterium]|nr:DNA-3-methyladenine glycosylase I [bacterium]